MPNGGAEMRYMGTSSVARDIDFMARVIDGPDASMFPNRIGKGMIEAIANPVIWAAEHSHQWMDNWVQSADETYTWFLESCAKAGEARCALAKGNSTAKSIRKRIESFINELEPLDVSMVSDNISLTPDRPNTPASIYNTLLFPSGWSDFASQLQSAMEGEPGPLLNQILSDPSRDPIDKGELGRYAITCADALPFQGPSSYPTPESLARGIISRIKNVSHNFGGSPGTTDIDGGCQFWPVDSVERFAGPWNKTLANPIVIVSSTVDPITPLASAQLVHKLLGNSSRLITVNAPG
ncbi:hypothetical protein FRC07_007237 [Ceratobasidium sp. 392]|nr:hypothetical protein FRC07_007237 [Ceratobasidium sp. 392]